MPDLKSELKKLEALKFDDDGDTTVITLQPAVALPDDQQGGVSRRLFNIVLNNPGCTRSKLMKLAAEAKIGDSSSSSLLVQFTRRGLLRAVDSPSGLTYFCVGTQYTPGYVKQAKKAAKVASPKAAKVPATTSVPLPANARFTATIPELLDTMSVVQAREMYDALKKIFGG